MLLMIIFQRRTGSGGNFLFYKAGFPYELNPNFVVHDFKTLSLFCFMLNRETGTNMQRAVERGTT